MASESEYLVPAQIGDAEYDEKRSRFLGHVVPVNSEEEARKVIEEIKKEHYDARHNCWCYLLSSGVERYSDDGEPQGTAGVPMLEVFHREKMTNLVCVVTRYFGGVLLGAGGLLRAYTKAAKDALDAAGTAVVATWDRMAVVCPYGMFERVKNLVEGLDGEIEGTNYAEKVTLIFVLPEERSETFTNKLTELSAGSMNPEILEKIEKNLRIRQEF